MINQYISKTHVMSRMLNSSLGKIFDDYILHLHQKGYSKNTIPAYCLAIEHFSQWMLKKSVLTNDINNQTINDFIKKHLPKCKCSVPCTKNFLNRNGKNITRSGVGHRLKIAVENSIEKLPSLRSKKISPHTIRHTTALHLLQSGVDLTVIALWLGHENITTTHHYVEANLLMKENALGKLSDPGGKMVRYKAEDKLLAFLDSL